MVETPQPAWPKEVLCGQGCPHPHPIEISDDEEVLANAACASWSPPLWKRLWDLSTHPVLCLSILLPLPPAMHLLSYGPTVLADSPSADDDQMIISKWR